MSNNQYHRSIPLSNSYFDVLFYVNEILKQLNEATDEKWISIEHPDEKGRFEVLTDEDKITDKLTNKVYPKHIKIKRFDDAIGQNGEIISPEHREELAYPYYFSENKKLFLPGDYVIKIGTLKFDSIEKSFYPVAYCCCPTPD